MTESEVPWHPKTGDPLSSVCNTSSAISRSSLSRSLQLGHDLSAVDTTQGPRRRDRNTRLQLSHDLSAVDTLYCYNKIQNSYGLQLSHDLSVTIPRLTQVSKITSADGLLQEVAPPSGIHSQQTHGDDALIHHLMGRGPSTDGRCRLTHVGSFYKN